MSIYTALTPSSIPRIVTFSSENLVSGSNSTFQSTPIDLGVVEFDSVICIDANIPKSFYNMPSNYNSFTLTESGSNVTVTIPVGSYNVNTLGTAIQTQLNAVSPHTWTYAVSYNTLTFHYDITVTGNSGQPSITMYSGFSSPFRQLGFEDSSTYTFSTNKLSSVNAVNLALVLTAYIQSDIVVNTYNGILQQFLNVGSFPPMSVMSFQQINYDLNAKYFNAGSRNSWTFSLVDDLFLPINTNGLPWSFTLCFFKRNVTHEIHQTQLELQHGDRAIDLENQKQNLLNDIENLEYHDEPSSSTVLPELEDPQIKYPTV